ncbi:MAG TPA: 50S ribosomal protein L25/general stress protein Ctc [Gammaproteobacteria bacterium]|nr:50S ribosomal protein L25/general stress protein Ctc [Gammaproteobacteria bacterium]HQZ87708.1 50S ribosomal protein L25/general stress protein Ctc [Gammaproteobacteria bacterium]HRA42945.1 50S ribosomal protein L25/general stress protein Ctc [Gammaproteobacteria bacterium]
MTAKATFELHAELRQDQGKGASRRLRRTQDKIPAIIYGGGEAPTAITLDHKKVMHALENKAFYSHILTLHIAGKKHKAVLKDLQRHHFKKAIFHMDFLRVNATDHLNMHIPLRFVGAEKAPGVLAGGIVNHPMIDVELHCLASDLPEEIVVDISKLDLDQSIHLSQLKLPKGTELVAFSHGNIADHDHAVVAIHLPRQMKEESETPAPEATETEVVPKGKEAKASAADGTTADSNDKEKGRKS